MDRVNIGTLTIVRVWIRVDGNKCGKGCSSHEIHTHMGTDDRCSLFGVNLLWDKETDSNFRCDECLRSEIKDA